ncbi:hypothetical protein FQR65_LT18619 [Abscondita terminalis]|nr:hypothetical protein FQR65_LT18619 [Abscondita terminalis]
MVKSGRIQSGEFGIRITPFLWGSKELARIYKEKERNQIFNGISSICITQDLRSPGSIDAVGFPWLITNELDRHTNGKQNEVNEKSFDVPYTKPQIDSANSWADNQAKDIVKRIYSEAADVKDQVEKEKAAKGDKFVPIEKREIVALIAYLQRLANGIGDLIENNRFRKLTEEEKKVYLEEKKTPYYKRLWASAFKKQSNAEEQDIIIDHGFDGITELDNSLPKWWLGLFYFGCIFCVVYVSAYAFTDYAHPVNLLWWICPQTIFMESVFRKIEYLIEGDRNKQIRLDGQPWNAEKIWKRGLKWTLFILISLIISHLMFAYIVGYERVLEIMKEGPFKKLSDNFLVMIRFQQQFYFVIWHGLGNKCVTFSVVLPEDYREYSLIKKPIMFFYVLNRGENRSKWRKAEDRKATGKGDCIDCGQCVVVCPTGIDIRNGQQLECINCTACIDACDEVMDKVGLPKGLIRYASEDGK